MPARADELQRIAMAIELDKGVSLAQVARRFKVSASYVRQLALETGLRAPKKRRALPQKKLSERAEEKIVAGILQGQDVADLALQFDVSPGRVRRLCQQQGIATPRPWQSLHKTERAEIKALLGENSAEEIAAAYNVSLRTIDRLAEEEYQQLGREELGFLFECLRADPAATVTAIQGHAKKQGFQISLPAIQSYRQRLKALGML